MNTKMPNSTLQAAEVRSGFRITGKMVDKNRKMIGKVEQR